MENGIGIENLLTTSFYLFETSGLIKKYLIHYDLIYYDGFYYDHGKNKTSLYT